MMINKSGTCAASRILQLRQMGVYECMVEDKIAKEAQVRASIDTDLLSFFDSIEKLWLSQVLKPFVHAALRISQVLAVS